MVKRVIKAEVSVIGLRGIPWCVWMDVVMKTCGGRSINVEETGKFASD